MRRRGYGSARVSKHAKFGSGRSELARFVLVRVASMARRFTQGAHHAEQKEIRQQWQPFRVEVGLQVRLAFRFALERQQPLSTTPAAAHCAAAGPPFPE